MQKLIIIAVLFVTSIVTAQSNYQKGMQQAFQLWKQNKPIEASNLFVRISKAETDNWLPSYYAAQINITKSFVEKDKNKLTTQLNLAQELLDVATSISKDNPEIMVLQALLYTVWVAYDGRTYGMKYSGKITEIYSRVLVMEPNNPRIVYNKAQWDIGSARFFGNETSPFCKDLEKSIELFAKFVPKSPFHPNWGKDQAEQAVKKCK